MVTDVTTQWSALSAHARFLAHRVYINVYRCVCVCVCVCTLYTHTHIHINIHIHIHIYIYTLHTHTHTNTHTHTCVYIYMGALSAHARILAHQHADAITAKGQSIERQKQSRASRKDTAKAAKKSAAAAAASSSSLRVLLVQCVGFE